MKKIRILLLTHYFSPSIGGIETVSRLLAEEFIKEHEVIVATWSKSTDADNFPFKVARTPGFLALLKYFFWADIVFENNPCLRLSWPGFIFRKRSIVVLHTWINHLRKKPGLKEKLKYKKLSVASRVIAISDIVRKKIWPSAMIIHSPYDEKKFNLNNHLVKTTDFVFVGRLVSDKGVDFLIKAIHKIIYCLKVDFFLTQRPLLTIVGDGIERENLKKLVGDLKLKGYVHFTGALISRQVSDELKKHKYLLVPSLWDEPFGIVALEGMACGCIPLVANSGGLPEAVGNAGVVFERDNQDSLISVINNIENNMGLQYKLKEASIEHLKLHTAEKISADYLALIKQIL